MQCLLYNWKRFLKYLEIIFSFYKAVLPIDKSQSLMVSSSDADTICFPSGENAIAVICPEWPIKVARATLVAESQSLIVWSSDINAICFLFGENAMNLAQYEEEPASVVCAASIAKFQSLTVRLFNSDSIGSSTNDTSLPLRLMCISRIAES